MASRKNGTLYIGVSSDLRRQVWQHKNDLFEGFTKKYSVRRLVWYQMTDQIGLAIQKEKRMKKWRRRWKIELIEEANPNWDDLYEELCQ